MTQLDRIDTNPRLIKRKIRMLPHQSAPVDDVGKPILYQGQPTLSPKPAWHTRHLRHMGGNILQDRLQSNMSSLIGLGTMSAGLDVVTLLNPGPLAYIALPIIAALSLGSLTGGILGIREHRTRKHLTEWQTRVTAQHLDNWLKTYRGIRVRSISDFDMPYVANIINNTIPGNQTQKVFMGSTSGGGFAEYRLRAGGQEGFQVLDTWNNDILTKDGWVAHKQRTAGITTIKAPIPAKARYPMRLSNGHLYHGEKQPTPTPKTIAASKGTPMTKPASATPPKPTTLLNDTDLARITAARQALHKLLGGTYDTETDHAIQRTLNLLTDLNTMDQKLLGLSPEKQPQGLKTLHTTLGVIEQEIHDIIERLDNNILKEARTLAGYAENLRAGKTSTSPLTLQ